MFAYNMSIFLQGFFEEKILFQADEASVIRQSTEKALDIAMMGLAAEAREILTLVTLAEAEENHKSLANLLANLFTPQLEFFMAESQPLCGVDAVDEEKILELEVATKVALPHLPEGIEVKDSSEESYGELKEFAGEMEGSWCSHATTGYDV